MIKRLPGLLVLTVLIASRSLGQGIDDAFTVSYDTPLTIDLEAEEEEFEKELIEPKKKKVKKNVFYGMKTKRGFTKTGFGSKLVVEQFHYLKEYVDPEPYVRDVYWYDFKKKKIIKSRRIDKQNGVILHGPYVKKLGEQVLEKGIYYKGTKHGRWVKLNRHDILQGKEKFYKGWPKQSKVAYYNREKRQLKEIIPVQFGEKEGYYYAFHKSGRVAARGEYHFDNKIGVWTEYYDTRRRKKREIQYPEDPFDESFEPYIIKEWDESGKVIYDHAKYVKLTSN